MNIEKLCILSGGGVLPTLLFEACMAQDIPVHLISFKGQPKPDNLKLSDEIHTELPLGAVGQTLSVLKQKNVTHVVMAGRLVKASLFDLKPDMRGMTFLAGLKRLHDDAILDGLGKLMENEGFTMVGAHEVVPNLIVEQGALTKAKPSGKDMADIDIATQALQRLGELDIGQAAVVKDKVVLGVEAVEGTDHLITRCAGLRGEKAKGGILAKCAKPNQNLKMDMPAAGPETVTRLVQHGYRGLVLEAGKTMLLDREHALEIAEKGGLFIYGV